MRASRITRRDTRQERAHSVEQHRNTFSSGQSLVKMDTVADGLASLSFHQEKIEREENRQWKQQKGKGKKTEFNKIVTSNDKCLFFLIAEVIYIMQR